MNVDRGELGQRYRSLAGFTLLFDNEGFLWEPADWTEEVAIELARENGIDVLTEDHWKVIKFMREFYFAYGKAPLNKQLRKGTGLSIQQIEKLFPLGIKKSARLIAGLPNPRACL
ncbi:MAG: TusE/DsrC/DsvC family sulfur relay protein [Bacillota bacterium]|jgi:TusE/DsrC/DsvC family sulfur relay protein|nr:TusE/DsrC/DsvC family sulfur relay protein [Bacillota bacterium]HHU29600.1 TusE/DsrC/DsvC family sulfur relay protein [Bacillota bacterium]